MLNSKSLNIRTIENRDLKLVGELFKQKCSFFILNGLPETSLTELKYMFLSAENANNECKYVIDDSRNNPIGIFALTDLQLSSRIVFMKIAWKERKKSREDQKIYSTVHSICKHLFCEENIHKIIVQILTNEHNLQKLLKRLEFNLEVRLREGLYHLGCYEDILTYGLLRDDFEKEKLACGEKAKKPY